VFQNVGVTSMRLSTSYYSAVGDDTREKMYSRNWLVGLGLKGSVGAFKLDDELQGTN
jgi:hypothetical protein